MEKLIIDGIETEPDPSRTVLQVAQELGIHIPTLCYHRSLSPYGACRICTVEIIWRGRSRLRTACTYPAWEGEVKTDSEPVRRVRRLLLETMLAEAPASPEIQRLAREYDVESTRFRVEEGREDNRCIQCGLCVRICEDVMKVSALGHKNRGFRRKVTTPFGASSDVCTGCGACEFVCPTGAIMAKDVSDRPIKKIGSEFELDLTTRPSIYVPFPQAVPNVPVIDDESCMHFKNEACGICESVCEPDAIRFSMEDQMVKERVGTIIVATGYDSFDPSLKPEYAYSTYENVISGLELERLLSASGPTGGKLEINGKSPTEVVFINCVGSRDTQVGNEYCSRVCCMYTAKQAYLIKEKYPDVRITVLYMDMRAFGKGFEEFYDRVREAGVVYRRGKPSEIYRKSGRLVVRAEDTVLGGPVEIQADLVVLSTGLVARADTKTVGQLLKISQSPDGFFLEAHPKLRPVETSSDGVYIAGCCQAPKDIPDTVAQAKGAAASAIVPMVQGKVKIEPITSSIDEELCAGCRVCEGLCEYKALIFDDEKGVMRVQEVLCKGCGSCGAACPAGAISMRHFTDLQLISQIKALVE